MTWQWRREDLTDYPPGTYTLKYVFSGPAGASFNFSATADAGAYAINVAATTTASFAPGVWRGAGYVDDGSGHKIEVWRGTLNVLPSLTSGDARTHVRKVLDAVEAVIESRASHSDLRTEIQTAGGMRRLDSFTPAQLLVLRDAYLRYWAQEKAAERVASGRPGGRKIVTRFGRIGPPYFPGRTFP